MKKRLFALLMCAILMVGCFAGCGGTTEESKTETSKTETSKTETSKAESSEEDLSAQPGGVPYEAATYPLADGSVELDYWLVINGAMSATMESYADVAFFQMLEEYTGVKINWDHNTSDENFSMMIASGEYPDLINWKYANIAGGVQALLEDEVIHDLTEMIPKYAPAYNEWMEANPEEKTAFTLGGLQYQFVNFNSRLEDREIVYFKILGPQIHQDWLDKVGKEMPTTTDELYDVLVAFRDNDMNGDGDATDEIPFAVGKGTDQLRALAGSFGTRIDMHVDPEDANTMVYGPITDNFKKFLGYVKKLYDEGLINSDFAVAESAMNYITQIKAGFTISSMGSSLIANHDNLKLENEEYNYVSVPWLIGPDGYQCFIDDSNANPRSTVVSTQCENLEIALRWLDYFYTDEGSIASTFGIEDESFEWVNEYPTIIEDIKNNDKGWSDEQCIARYMLGPITFPMARDYRFYEQMNLKEQYQIDIQTNWNLATNEITMPPLIHTTEEAEEYSGLMTDIKTYVDTSYLEFIVGDLDLEADWDTYVSNVKSMGIEDAIAIKQAAYERAMGK